MVFTCLQQKLGGSGNAFTDKCKTNYHFHVNEDTGFVGPRRIMEMLADLISFPLFRLDSIQREIESVDNGT
jgi:secreted Zn-dependent insulinase-like peptidase